ncbi:hemerythrin domain-containing protein [Hydrogenophaga sp. OTU3427]|uniref:hemerythrin domain-containing protein n=1 Tax=Hydrogenophaga sp. OTU3427 TaxID=3043856 RepID=UPI00313E2586
MQFDNAEMAAVAQALAPSTAPALPRLDLYAGIHKALRAAMADTLLALGRCDPQDADDLDEAAERVRSLLCFCAKHLEHENAFVHTAMEARAPGSSGAAAQEHVAHVAAIDTLRAELGQLLAGPEAARAALLLRFYQRLSLFVAENFEHMLVEETRHNAVLWARYSDAELAQVHNNLVASIPPAEMMDTLRWLLPHMHHGERVGMLSDMQAHAPAPAFDAALAVARFHLSERDWHKLGLALQLPVAAQSCSS